MGRQAAWSGTQEPSAEPKASDQYNFTDPESRIMKEGSGQHFEQCYNAQAAVEVDSRLIVGERVSQAPNDKQELVPSVAAISQPVESVGTVLTDSGFYSEAAVRRWNELAQVNLPERSLCGGGEKRSIIVRSAIWSKSPSPRCRGRRPAPAK